MSKSPNNTLNIKPISKTYINDTELESNFVLKEIYVKKEINKIGQFDINIILHSEVQTKISLKVEKLDKLQEK